MEKPVRGSDYLYLALYAFAGFAFELLLVGVVEPALGLSPGHLTMVQNIIHWLVTSAVWLAVGQLLIRLAKKQYGFDLRQHRSPFKPWQIAAAAGCVAVMALAHYLDWGGFKPYLEYQRLGLVKFIFQYLYYFAETFLLSLIIVFGQQAGERWFGNTAIPYGGIVLGLTWGLAHILSKGSAAVGLLSAAGGFLMGASYLIMGRDYRKALPLLYLMFVI